MTDPCFFSLSDHPPTLWGCSNKNWHHSAPCAGNKKRRNKKGCCRNLATTFFHKIDADSSLHKQQSAAQSPKTTATATITMTTTTSTSDDDSNDDSGGDNDNDIASFLSSSGRIQRIRQSQKQEKIPDIVKFFARDGMGQDLSSFELDLCNIELLMAFNIFQIESFTKSELLQTFTLSGFQKS